MLNVQYIQDFKAGQPFLLIAGDKAGFLKAAVYFERSPGCFLNDKAIATYDNIAPLEDGSLYVTAQECAAISRLFREVASGEDPRHLYFDTAALKNIEVIISYKEHPSLPLVIR